GKITGLAAFGNPNIERLGLQNLIHYNNKKHRFISKGVATHHKNLLGKSPYFGPLISKFSKEDLAAVTQEIFEKVVIEFVKDAYELAKQKGYHFNKICLAGGCF